MSKSRALIVAALFVVILCILTYPWKLHPEDSSPSSKRLLVSAGEDQTDREAFSPEKRRAAISAYIENIRRDQSYDWKQEIQFYGKVLDQDGSPVEDASVYFQWTTLSGKNGVISREGKTDTQGLFSLKNARGKNLSVRIEKKFYHTLSSEENQTSFEYANPGQRTFHVPSQHKPVIFLLRRKQSAQGVLSRELELTLSGQGTSRSIDLTTGSSRDSGGQVSLTIWKPENTHKPFNGEEFLPYDWRIQIKVNDGALVECAGPFAFMAPEVGYIDQFEKDMHVTSEMRRNATFERQFYFYYGHPKKYGYIKIRTNADQQRVSIKYRLNSNGSRNLEPYTPN